MGIMTYFMLLRKGSISQEKLFIRIRNSKYDPDERFVKQSNLIFFFGIG